MSKIICFYHSADLDGHCSGALVDIFHRGKVDLKPINYDDPFPWEDITPGDTVYMVDFGLQPFEDMIRLNALCNLIWIDHHKTAIDDYNAYMEGRDKQYAFKGICQNGFAGCELTWKYLFGEKDLSSFFDPHMPRPVYYIGRYDVWRWQDIPNSMPFLYGMKSYQNTHPTNRDLWNTLLVEEDSYIIKDIISKGKSIIDFEKAENRKACEYLSFETVFDGHPVIAINKGPASSQIFESVWDNEKYDMMLAFVCAKGKLNISLYTDKDGIDVGEICKKYGGGGHVQAAGMTLTNLPFDI